SNVDDPPARRTLHRGLRGTLRRLSFRCQTTADPLRYVGPQTNATHKLIDRGKRPSALPRLHDTPREARANFLDGGELGLACRIRIEYGLRRRGRRGLRRHGVRLTTVSGGCLCRGCAGTDLSEFRFSFSQRFVLGHALALCTLLPLSASLLLFPLEA